MFRSAAALIAVMCYATAQEGPSLVVHKTLDADSAVQQKNLTVTVAVYNLGSAAAFDVNLEDTWELEALGGSKAKKWDTIEPRGSVTHSFTLLPSASGNRVDTQPAKVTYATEAKGEARKTATSNDLVDVHYTGRPDERMSHPRNSIPVITLEEFHRQSSRRIKEWVTFALLLIIPVIMPAYFWKISTNSLDQKRETVKASAKEDQKAKPSAKASKAKGSGRRSAGGSR